MDKNIDKILAGIVHPETGVNIVESGIAEKAEATADKIAVTLAFPKARDPFAGKIKRQVEQQLTEAFPAMTGKVEVIIKEGVAKAKENGPAKPEQANGMARVKKIIAVSSAKGGVGKSTVATNLAVTLAAMGYKTGLLDADIYGPSLPKMMGLEDFLPEAEERDGHTYMIPATAYGVKVMSIGFFIRPDDALVWRGPMATGALRQLIHQTDWGQLDILVIDMPPGTGDVHLTILAEMKVDGAVIVSTPQQVAVADVVRGIAMFRSEQVNVPLVGIIENMAWFTPDEMPDKRYYIFGQGGASRLATEYGIATLGEIPIVMAAMDGGDQGKPGVTLSAALATHYQQVARAVVNNL